MKHKDAKYTECDITLDGNEFENCQFINCKLRYSGGPIQLANCVIDKPQFMLSGPALRTMQLLGVLYQASPPAVEKIFEGIRKMGPSPSDSVIH